MIPGISRSETVHDIFQTKYIVLLFIHLYAFWYTLALALGKHIRQADILAAPLRTTVYTRRLFLQKSKITQQLLALEALDSFFVKDQILRGKCIKLK